MAAAGICTTSAHRESMHLCVYFQLNRKAIAITSPPVSSHKCSRITRSNKLVLQPPPTDHHIHGRANGESVCALHLLLFCCAPNNLCIKIMIYYPCHCGTAIPRVSCLLSLSLCTHKQSPVIQVSCVFCSLDATGAQIGSGRALEISLCPCWGSFCNEFEILKCNKVCFCPSHKFE